MSQERAEGLDEEGENLAVEVRRAGGGGGKGATREKATAVCVTFSDKMSTTHSVLACRGAVRNTIVKKEIKLYISRKNNQSNTNARCKYTLSSNVLYT